MPVTSISDNLLLRVQKETEYSLKSLECYCWFKVEEKDFSCDNCKIKKEMKITLERINNLLNNFLDETKS